MGTLPKQAERLYKDFADYSAQRHAQLDGRDREHLDAIGNDVENRIAKDKAQNVEQNDIVYISTRAPSRIYEWQDVRHLRQERSIEGVAHRQSRIS